MDVLKGCASNVHVVKDIDTTRLRLFVCEEVQQIPGVVKELRSNGAMCSAASDRLCIFYGAEEETSDHVETPFRLELEGTIAEHSQLTAKRAIHRLCIPRCLGRIYNICPATRTQYSEAG
jgi:hypothetical protein